MPVKIRLARRGRSKSPYYHIIVADSRSPRDGRFIEKIGSYNPMTKPATIDLDRDKAYDWLMKGAQPTDTARAILRFKGIMYRKHLQRGVEKGAFSQEEADGKYAAYIEEKEAKVSERMEQSKKEKEDFLRQVSGSTVKKAEDLAPATDAMAEFQEAAEKASVSEASIASSGEGEELTAVVTEAPEGVTVAKEETSEAQVASEEVAPAKEETSEAQVASEGDAPAKEETSEAQVASEEVAPAKEETSEAQVASEGVAPAKEETSEAQAASEEVAPAKEETSEAQVASEEVAPAKEETSETQAASEEVAPAAGEVTSSEHADSTASEEE